ncbi:hypothetical protein SUNI508_00875 [Seiridium unicorne]|uniref:Uncharacterized protein n=1 Tax=Seiridium unicorne TaxID=138068 RepID=A0ABR2V1I8_9PEZI
MYGGNVREIDRITNWKPGAIVAENNFKDGVVDGFTDLVREPVQGALGLVAYFGHGICKSVAATVITTT